MATFLLFTTLGSLIWNTVFVVAGYVLGENRQVIEDYAGTYQNLVLAAASSPWWPSSCSAARRPPQPPARSAVCSPSPAPACACPCSGWRWRSCSAAPSWAGRPGWGWHAGGAADRPGAGPVLPSRDRAPGTGGGGHTGVRALAGDPSPADKVPSHGLHAYGQTYAIDLVHEPVEGSARVRPGAVVPPPEDFRPSASRCWPRRAAWSSVHGRERDHQAAAPGRACSTCSRRARCASSPGPAGCSQPRGARPWRRRVRRARPSPPRLARWQGPQVEADEQVADCGNSSNSPSRTSTSADGPPQRPVAAGCPSGWPFPRGRRRRRGRSRPTAGRPF